MKVKLTGITRKGKQRVKQHGEIWKVRKEMADVLWSKKKGPWLLIDSLDGKDTRAVNERADTNFEVEVIE